MRQPPGKLLALFVSLALVAALTPRCFGASDAEFQHLIANLDHDQFELRESATRQLILAGPAAAQSLKRAALEGSAEVTWRAVHVLSEIAVAGDFDKRNIAEEALQELATSNNLSASRRAAEALVVLPGSRQARAIAMVRSLGGKIDESGFQLKLDELWEGGDTGLRYIRYIAALRHINIEPTAPITDEGVRKLRQSLPEQVRIVQFGTAFLGVGAASEDGSPGMLVVTVAPKSPAEKAGIAEGDVITKIDNRAVNGFDDLVAVIRTKKPGDTAVIEYIDNATSEPAKTKVTLGSRPGVLEVEMPKTKEEP